MAAFVVDYYRTVSNFPYYALANKTSSLATMFFLLLHFCSLGRTPKRKLSLSANDCLTSLTPKANGTFQRSLSTTSNESGNPFESSVHESSQDRE